MGPFLLVFPAPSTVRANTAAVARFDGGLTLDAVTQYNPSPRPGGVLSFTLLWQAERRLTGAYAVSVRLVGPSGAVLAAHDERHPALGTSPTNTWAPGQVIGDYHGFPLGSRLAPGMYQLQILPYLVEPLGNLRRLDERGQPGEEGVSVPIEVGPRQIGSPLDLLTRLLAR